MDSFGKHTFLPFFCLLYVCISPLNTGLLFAENTIVPFDEKKALNFSGKYNMGIFQQQAAGYRTGKPWDIGFGIRYKSIAAQLYMPIAFNNDSFDVALNFYFEKMYYETFIKHYKNFYNGDDKTGEHENVGLDIMSGGIMAS
ncbi:hypothetical protein TREPR_2714 [Treponema primitia ZAS-2]|uniref:Uncharacterized protein n=2 Tax=Treponema primitia TaxID=88058 RepID=F5YQM0_TREPZ|nr:hypothetical protein TREPR_2714 [Treponema primitia ZAS-2]